AAMQPYFEIQYGNPSSAYRFSGKIAQEVDKARETIASVIGCSSKEIYFTGGGSESDNWALKGVVEASKVKPAHIITTKIEHHAILHTCEYLEKQGVEVTYLDVDENGLVTAEQVEAAMKDNTILVSIMFANNEIGTIEPIKAIGEVVKKHGAIFHTDAVQAFGHVPINVDDMHIDLMSASAHKINGPKGVGFLYIRKGTRLENLIHGGGQERGRRAGTTNAAGIIGFGEAARLAAETMEDRIAYESRLRDKLIDEVLKKVPYTRVNGDRESRLPNNVNFCFRFIEGESLLLLMDQFGICGSSGSACTSGSLDPSHVLLAIGLPHEIAHGSLRLTLSEDTTEEEIDYTIETIAKVVDRLRMMSPLYEDYKKKHPEG
ncbi:MAG: cysteine desulfurase NifS, partial [Lachnospiraceae bacterium]|nr:cysteine desulfurase NifS [Candidatus Equihabitans merdae]